MTDPTYGPHTPAWRSLQQKAARLSNTTIAAVFEANPMRFEALSLESQGLLLNATAMGELLETRLRELMQTYPFIGDVRGKGLLLAFELVAERDRLTPLPAGLKAYEKLVNLAYERGLIIYSRRTRDGIEGDHFLVCPPMIVTAEQIDEIIGMLRASLDALAAELDLPMA